MRGGQPLGVSRPPHLYASAQLITRASTANNRVRTNYPINRACFAVRAASA